MSEYRCSLVIEVDASDPLEAAATAQEILVDDPSFEDRLWLVEEFANTYDSEPVRRFTVKVPVKGPYHPASTIIEGGV